MEIQGKLVAMLKTYDRHNGGSVRPQLNSAIDTLQLRSSAFQPTMADVAKLPETKREHERPASPSYSSSSASSFASSANSELPHTPWVPEGPDLAYLEKLESRRSGLSRRITRTSSILPERAGTALARIRSRRPTAPFTHPLEAVRTGPDVLVTFDGKDDPYNPLNWGFKKKVITTLLYGLTTMGATWASSVYSPAVGQIAHDFHVGQEVSILGLSFLLFGFGLGPLIWAPLSEVYGRKPAVLIPYFIAAIFSFGTAAAKDIQTVLITRFFAGLFGSAPVTNTGGVLGDIWPAEKRGVAIVGYAMAVVGGPVLGPIVGGAIVQSYLRWRWTEYVSLSSPQSHRTPSF
jgi:Major Facilitator Superfamily